VTAFDALAGVERGNYFLPGARRRIVVLLTDGESNPVNPGELAQSLAQAHGYRFLAVRFFGVGEAVYGGDNRPEPGYRPDPSSRATLASLAGALGGRTFEEGNVGSASSYLAGLAGSGPTRATRAGAAGKTHLAPYVAALALLLVLLSLEPFQRRVAEVGSAHQ
jgi:hypothetical protein